MTVKLAYFLNSYPYTSLTFIRGEIAAIEASGLPVTRYAIRPWPGELVTPEDKAEAARTRYLLADKRGLLLALLRLMALRPGRFLRALALWGRLVANAGGGLARHLAYFVEAALLADWARADGITHIHTHFATNGAAVAMLAEAMGGARWSMTVHGPNEFFDPERASVPLKADRAVFIAAISHFAKGQVATHCGMAAFEKTHVVRCGVDLEAFDAAGPPAAAAPVVHVGRLCVEKAQVLFPAAVAAAAEKAPALKLDIIGDGDLRGAVAAAIEATGTGERIAILGWRDHAEVRARLAAARGLLLPSFAEGLPVAIMEALALGRPVVTTSIAGIPELVDESCGWVIPAGDEAALAEALTALATAPAERLAEMGRAGRARVAAMHDQTANAARLRELIEAAHAGEAGAG
ncbi:MAG: glycosyltransferase family 4 protein [Pseudomonadota bacterium]